MTKIRPIIDFAKFIKASLKSQTLDILRNKLYIPNPDHARALK